MVDFGPLTGGKPVVGVWGVGTLASLHPARLRRRALPHLSLMDQKVKKKVRYRHFMTETLKRHNRRDCYWSELDFSTQGQAFNLLFLDHTVYIFK